MTTLIVEGTGTNIRKMVVSGHAEFTRRRRDIVCAAVSILITTCVNALETVAGTKPDVWQDEKIAVIAVTLPRPSFSQPMTAEQFMYYKQTKRDAQIILRTVLQGFTDIAEEYPEHMEIIDRRK